MKKFILLNMLFNICAFTYAQNVGIGNPTPAEKLDVNGNINLTGQLKVSGNAGIANQVLIKDGLNNLSWGDITQYKNMITFDCTSHSVSCSSTWTVPAGVTTILVECWGGGGGGSTLSGGGGGGYIIGKLTVIPSATATLTIGFGGGYAGGGGANGGASTFTISGSSISAFGGGGGSTGDPSVTGLSEEPAIGGIYGSSGVAQTLGFYGETADFSKLTFMQAAATDFAKAISYGNGGDAANTTNSGGKGGYRIISTSFTQNIFSQGGLVPGGGGGADAFGGFYGAAGRILIHW